MNVDTAAIVRKADEALTTLANYKGMAATLAADPNATAEQWGTFALKVAELEGSASAWHRLATMAQREHVELSVKEVAFALMLNGADDTYSGRGNDVRRARQDGVRAACSDMQWL